MFEHASNKDKANNGKKLSGPKKFFYFCKKKMIENLSDKEIIERLRLYDEKVTREFFYDICHVAYCIDDKKYGLRYKTGMDFYSLAHEYYLRLCNNGWHQLENCKPGVPLANWTMNGFHFLVRERLKAYSKGHLEESIEAVTRAVSYEGPSAVVFRAPCVNLVKPGAPAVIDAEQCVGCKRCITSIGCPAIGFDGERATIDRALCNGCGLCTQVCPFDAILLSGGSKTAQ